MNGIKLFVLMAGLTALLGAVGGMLGGSGGALFAIALAAGTNLFLYAASDRLVLRAYQARLVDQRSAPQLHAMVDELRRRAGLPMPAIAIAPHEQPNAFATGRSPRSAVICVTEGILRALDRDELEGVLAHEIAHVRHHDMLLQTVTATLAGAVTNLARFGPFLGVGENHRAHPMAAVATVLLAPIGAMLVQFAVSRQREFAADRGGAELTGNPRALAGALRTLDEAAHRIPLAVNPAAAQLALVDPLAAFSARGALSLFATHPPTAERVARLEAMARSTGSPAVPV